MPPSALLQPPARKPPKPRSDSHRSRYRYVRRILRGKSFQARVPLGADPAAGRTKGESVNLGLYSEYDHGSIELAEWAAGRAAKEFVKRHRPYQPGGDLCSVLESLKRDRIIPAHILPPRVVEVPFVWYGRGGGECHGYGAVLRRWGRVITLEGPYPTPRAAFVAVSALVAAELAARTGATDCPFSRRAWEPDELAMVGVWEDAEAAHATRRTVAEVEAVRKLHCKPSPDG